MRKVEQGGDQKQSLDQTQQLIRDVSCVLEKADKGAICAHCGKASEKMVKIIFTAWYLDPNGGWTESLWEVHFCQSYLSWFIGENPPSKIFVPSAS
jgi:hypothetical protein